MSIEFCRVVNYFKFPVNSRAGGLQCVSSDVRVSTTGSGLLYGTLVGVKVNRSLNKGSLRESQNTSYISTLLFFQEIRIIRLHGWLPFLVYLSCFYLRLRLYLKPTN